MSKVVIALILTAAAAVGGSVALALKPAVKPHQLQPQQFQTPPQVWPVGTIPPTLPPSLSYLQGIPWVGAGGSLCACKTCPNIQGNLVFPNLPPPLPPDPAKKFPGSTGAWLYFVAPTRPGDPVLFTVCSGDNLPP